MSALRIARWERFCREYVKDLDARAAAIRAGYMAGPHIRISAMRLLRHAGGQARIAELQERSRSRRRRRPTPTPKPTGSWPSW